MIKIYCDNGAYRSWLKEYQEKGQINIFGFPYENLNKRIFSKGIPSNLTWGQFKVPWNECDFTWNDMEPSNKFDEIKSVLSATKTGDIDVDVQHLDSAYKNKCHIFLTTDKHDIIQNKVPLEEILELKIFHPDEDSLHIRNLIKDNC